MEKKITRASDMSKRDAAKKEDRRKQPDLLKVFISSAQNNENGFVWTSVRKKIADKLSEYDFIKPFIIEETGSDIPSAQYFMSKAQGADIIVLLVKSVLRPGTLIEYSIAKQFNIPLFVYFLKDSNPDRSVTAFKQKLMREDPSTYHPVPNIDRIDECVGLDIINSMVLSYQDNKSDSSVNKKVANQLLAEVKDLLISPDAQRKIDIARFGSCYNHMFDLLNLGFFRNECEKSELHHFGCLLIDWLVTGKWNISDRDISGFLKKNTIDVSDGKWLKKRWNAIQTANKDDLEKAFREEKLALKNAKRMHADNWIISDILIDCRNLEIVVDALYRRRKARLIYQEELDAQTSVVCYPVLDRYLTDIYDCIECDEFREKTASVYSELFGSNMASALSALANYLFTAAMYGSYTHIRRAHIELSIIMEHYYALTGDSSFVFMALQQKLLSGETKDFDLFINYSWDDCYSDIIKHADELWKLTDQTPVSNRDAMKLSVIACFGPYMTNKSFAEISKYLFAYSSNVYWNNSERYFDAVLKNLHRLNANRVIEVVGLIIAEKRYSVGYKATQIICNLQLEKVSARNLKKLNEILCDKLSYLISVNGDPRIIGILTDYNKEIFGDLLNLEVNNLPGVRRVLKRLDHDFDDYVLIMKEEIDSARAQYKENTKQGVYAVYAHNPYATIGAILRENAFSEGIMELLVKDFIPLSIEVLVSKAAVALKESCTACLCDVVGFFHKFGYNLPGNLVHALTIVDINKGSDYFCSGSRKALEIRVIMAKWLAGITGNDSLLSWCLEYGDLNDKEKIVLMDCVEKYLFLHRIDQGKTNPLLLSIVLRSASEKRPEVRRIAVRCLAYIVGKEGSIIVADTLKRAACDSSERIRTDLLFMCRKEMIPCGLSNELMHILMKDANYNIRNMAKGRIC